MPVSEDLLSIWAGSVIASEPAYPAWHYALALYGGVILSDLITFNLGRLTQRGLGKRIQEAVFKDPVKVEKAMARIRKHGDSIGFVQRFSVGARLPLSFLAGYTGISPLAVHRRSLSRCIDYTATAVVCRLLSCMANSTVFEDMSRITVSLSLYFVSEGWRFSSGRSCVARRAPSPFFLMDEASGDCLFLE